MNTKHLHYGQIALRIAISAAYLSAVADRFGLWGAPGTNGVSWGNWENFLAYSNTVNAFWPATLHTPLAVIATALEILLPVALLTGFFLRQAALVSCALLASFGISMSISFGLEPALSYSVWTSAAASYLLYSTK